MIKVDNLIKNYGKEGTTKALKGVTIEFPEHGFVSILGPSGCGKSTLLNLLGLLDQPTSGNIIIDGVPTKNLDSNKQDKIRNETIGFIFQSYHLIPTLSILDNVILPLEVNNKVNKKEQKEKALILLKQLGLEEIIDKKTNELSGGQKQRVAIARALINDPKIILADEPTGALDSKNSVDVLNILKTISKSKLVVFVTHNEYQAKEYSDRIIYLKDGLIETDEVIQECPKVSDDKLYLIDEHRKLMKTKNVAQISSKSFLSKKMKTILTSVANCFGLVALGFVLAITNGFTIYKDRVDSQTASNLPINVPAYSIKKTTDNWKDVNQSEQYPDNKEIYPFVSANNSVTYTYNSYSQDYFDFLDQLVEEGLVLEYLFNYGNAYSYNLTTEFPVSINGRFSSYVDYVETSLSAGGNYTSSTYGIPTNIFHPLYGDLDSGYDLIYGQMPQKKTDLVLVVNEYNAINFETLQYLGFYNENDKEDDVKDPKLESKVKPISFDDIIGKKYKIFTNDELYKKREGSKRVYDQFCYKYGSFIHEASYKDLVTYNIMDRKELFKDSTKGIELEIKGIIRPKSTSTISLLAPSLCYLDELQNDLNENKKASEIAKSMTNNVVYISDNPTSNLDIVEEINRLLHSYDNNISNITPQDINEIANKYFRYYIIDDGNYLDNYYDRYDKEPESYRYSSFTGFLNTARKMGTDLVLDETKEVLSSGDDQLILNYVTNVLGYFKTSSTSKEAYEHFISLVAFMNSYSDIANVAIFPVGLFERSLILNRLDEFNNTREQEKDKIYYLDVSNYMIETVGDMVNLISLVLLIFVIVLVLVACVMNILFTYNNVLERKKDIGIFRAVGMRKFDVSRVFIFEASIVGLLSGLMGVLITYILEFPVNYAVKMYYTEYFNIGNICVLSWWHIVLLIILGLVLGILSSIIPSYAAANKDPVNCLKDE